MKKVVLLDANEFALFNEGEQLGLHIPADVMSLVFLQMICNNLCIPCHM
jgi:hypothetical protein